MFLEEKLHIIYLLFSHFDTKWSLCFLHAIWILFNFDPNGEEVAPYGNLTTERNPYKDPSEREIDTGVTIHKLE